MVCDRGKRIGASNHHSCFFDMAPSPRLMAGYDEVHPTSPMRTPSRTLCDQTCLLHRPPVLQVSKRSVHRLCEEHFPKIHFYRAIARPFLFVRVSSAMSFGLPCRTGGDHTNATPAGPRKGRFVFFSTVVEFPSACQPLVQVSRWNPSSFRALATFERCDMNRPLTLDDVRITLASLHAAKGTASAVAYFKYCIVQLLRGHTEG